jgi:hypothetical protein
MEIHEGIGYKNPSGTLKPPRTRAGAKEFRLLKKLLDTPQPVVHISHAFARDGIIVTTEVPYKSLKLG